MDSKSYKLFYFITGFAITFLVTKLVFVIFHFADDIVHLGRLFFSWLRPKQEIGSAVHEKINRLQFINQAGLLVSGFVFGSMIYGQIKGKYNFKVWRQNIPFPDLPEAFAGIKIVQLSDMHLGSFMDNSFDEVKEAIAKVNELEPDYIFFTGDLVNNYAYEAEPWIEIIASLKAKRGKYSILGNHDYSDYVPWKNPEEKKANIERLFEIHEEMGFKLLKNETAILEKDGQEIALVGVENWGKGFHQYGDLNKALEGLSETAFKILLSHDPTHFDQAVMGKTNIALTMSGHTHGMQMGIEIPSLGIKISPIQLRYKRWAGLYDINGQYLYVNRGFGFLGFPGRVGIYPEITLLELQKA